MIVYKTTNLINGKVYIGKDTKNNPTYLGSGVLLHKAINKYGRESFTKEILFESLDIEEINQIEKEYIKKYKLSMGNDCYNIAEGGTGGDLITHHPNRDQIIADRNKAVSIGLLGHSVSDEAKKKQSESHTGWFDRMSAEDQLVYKENRSKTMKDYLLTHDHPSKGKTPSESTKAKLSTAAIKNGFGGDTWSSLSDEEKTKKSEKISKALIGKISSEETKSKISNSLKGHKISDETRKKISETLKNKNKNKNEQTI